MTLALLSMVVSMAISFGVFLNYVTSVLQGKTKPHAYTWLIWGITQATAVAGIWYGNGGLGAWALTVSTIFVFLVFLLSLKYGTRNITTNDTAVLIMALLAIAVWWQTADPFGAIIMVTMIDVLGYIPSWRKSVREPWSEALVSWSISPIGHLFAILAFTEYNFYTLTYPSALIICNLILVVICLVCRRHISRPY